jgi:hypothetical protein
VDFVKTAFEAVEPERLEDDAGVLQVARLGIGEAERNPAAIRPEFRTCADSRPGLYSRLQRRPEDG